MAGYIGSKAVLLSTTAAVVAGDADISGDLTVDTNTLVVDATNNAVGIRTATPAAPLHVSYSNTAFLGGLRVENTATTGNNWGRIDLRSASASADFAISQLPNGDAQVNLIGNGNLIFATNNAERARISASGNMLVGASGAGGSSRIYAFRDSPVRFDSANTELASNTGDVILSLHAIAASAACIDHLRGGSGVRVVDANRSVFAPIAASAFNVNSDYRIKESIQPLQNAADRLNQIPVHRFAFTEGSMMYRDGALVDGFLAHEVQAVIPEAVTGDKDAVNDEGQPIYQSIDQSKLVPLLTAALQEALTKIDALEARIVTLEGGAA